MGKHIPIYEEQDPGTVDALLSAIGREAAAIELYSRLADAAPNPTHRNQLQQIADNKKQHFNQFVHLYFTFTGAYPNCRSAYTPFRDYGEGLDMALAAEWDNCRDYRSSFRHVRHPFVRHILWHAAETEAPIHAQRIRSLRSDAATDYGPQPYVAHLHQAAKQNETYRTTMWTGTYLQMTVMSIPVGDDIGLEIHPETDQFIRVEKGEAFVQMGDSRDRLNFEATAKEGDAILVPAGKWHNVTNTGQTPLKVTVLYAPPHHPHGTVHKTKAEAMATGT
ncbi:cupin domain-containing protein [Paenibacillus cymbidii]|uniref:cupin domain-containing protein n=1 Tax=Paenibacillus cymbidii TaxID=1639034 RepID=UPI001436801B|nr:cupin domain-containing protein [Paenibacillus cymbidii]